MKMLLLNLPQFLTLVASFFPCLFWAHKYLYTSSFGNEIPLRKVMGLHKLQPTGHHPEATRQKPQEMGRDFIRDSHQEFFYTPTFMNHSSRFHLLKITSFPFFRFCHPAQVRESLHFVETPILGANEAEIKTLPASSLYPQGPRLDTKATDVPLACFGVTFATMSRPI